MAQTTTKYRAVYGTEAKYTANPAKYANDKYICTDTGVMYVKGKRVSAYEADLQWGGKDYAGGKGLIDIAIMDSFRGNQFEFIPASAVTIEYSRDGGATWTDYGASDKQKTLLFTGCHEESALAIGKNTEPLSTIGDAIKQYQLRITVDTYTASIYALLKKMYVRVSTNASLECWATVQGQTAGNYANGIDSWTTFKSKATLSGWANWNVLNDMSFRTSNWSNSASDFYQFIRFTFGCDSRQTTVNQDYTGLSIIKILAIASSSWNWTSGKAKYGTIYSYDYLQNAIFPAGVSATKFYGAGVKDATSVSHTNMATERDKVPCMGFLSYWNGAFQSNGASNLRYCAKGAFGNLAVKDNLPIDNGANKSNCLQFMQTSSADIVDKPGAGGSWYHIIKMNHGTGDTYYKSVIAFPFNSHRPMVNRALGNGVLLGWKVLALTEDIPTSPSSLKGTLYCDPSTGEFHCAGMDTDFSEAPLASVKEKLEIPTIYSLTVKGSAGSLNATYDPDSAAKTIDITPASIGAATATDMSTAKQNITALIEASEEHTQKLNNIEDGAEVNQNAYSAIAIDGNTPQLGATGKTATLNLKTGANITFTADRTNQTLTISATNTDTKVTSAANHYTPTAATYTPTNGGALNYGDKVIKSVTKDAKGHIVGVTEGQLPPAPVAYTHPTYTARTGFPTANATPGFGSTFSVSQIVTDGTGHVTAANTRTVKIPNTAATSSALGLVKIGSNITVSSGTISLTSSNVTSALGYTPAKQNLDGRTWNYYTSYIGGGVLQATGFPFTASDFIPGDTWFFRFDISTTGDRIRMLGNSGNVVATVVFGSSEPTMPSGENRRISAIVSDETSTSDGIILYVLNAF